MHSPSPWRTQHGVTLVELLVTLAIGVIMLTLGVTGMTALVKRHARTSEVNTLVANLNYARAEAVMRATDVVVCPIDPENLPDEPTDPCVTIKSTDGEDRQWQQGYVIYDDSTRERLRIQPPSKGVTIETKNTLRFTFHDDGSANNDTLRICDLADNADSDVARDRSVAPPRAVTISPVGRIRVAELMPESSDRPSRDINCKGDPP
jgi:type IV fimbrial biogenesis protein FimT